MTGPSRRRLAAPTVAMLVLALVAAPAAMAVPADDPAAHAGSEAPTADPADPTGPTAAAEPADPAEPADRVVLLWEGEVAPAVRDAVLAGYGRPGLRLGRMDTVEVGADRAPAVAAALAAHPQVAAAEPDRPVALAAGVQGTSTLATSTSTATPASAPAPAPAPNDPLFGEQWGLENTGQLLTTTGSSASTPGVDVGARRAWAWTRGTPQITVAVIDSGVDLAHPDLAGAFWQNPGESADGRDTDGNGFVDDLNGWDFIAGRPVIAAEPTSMPAEVHGTQVAGVIAARQNDVFGITGLAPEVRIMALRGFEEVNETSGAGSSDIATLVAAIGYAVANGADLINASWEAGVNSAVLERAVADARIPVVAAAGNRGLDLDGPAVALPASFDLPNVLAVTAIDPKGERPSFASYGATTVDLAAPGVSIVTTTRGGGHTRIGIDGGAVSGTSFSAPLVSAALALGWSVAPTTSTADLIDTLLRTTVPQPSVAGITTTGGRLDAGAFLAGLERPVCGRAGIPVAGFPDVAPAGTHARAIDCIADAGVTTGFPDGTFRPGGEVTRGQLATFLAGVLEAAGAFDAPAVTTDTTDTADPADPADGDPADPADDGPTGIGSFPDAFPDDDGSVHEPAIDALAALGILQGDRDGLIRHRSAVTRGQLAAMLVRTHAVLVAEERTPTRPWFPDVAGTTHATSIAVARDLGLVRGRDRVTYDTAATSRRDQMASTLARLLDALARDGVSVQER